MCIWQLGACSFNEALATAGHVRDPSTYNSLATGTVCAPPISSDHPYLQWLTWLQKDWIQGL